MFGEIASFVLTPEFISGTFAGIALKETLVRVYRGYIGRTTGTEEDGT